MESDILVVALAVLAFGLIAGRVRSWPITMPMVFTGAGLLLGPGVLGVLNVDVENEGVGALAEATLVVVLFTDASRMDLRSVLSEHTIALRLLLLGLPLAVVIGIVPGLLLLPSLPLAAAALLAATLAPTDAALGQAFVSDNSVPGRIRQTLNVESGLNDGLAVPFITVLLDIARHQTDTPIRYAGLLAALIGIGIAVGGVTGWLGGRLLEWSAARDWATETTQRLATMAVAAVAYGGSELIGGNGFVATFVAGLVVGTTARTLLPHTTGFGEAEGQLLSLVTFLLFGAVMVKDVVASPDWRYISYALASLLLVRPVAVAVSLLGAGLRLRTIGFIGWAGPRGLASIVYAVLIAETAGVRGGHVVFLVAGWTILLSVYLHGSTASFISASYGAWMQQVEHRQRREHHPVSALPVRLPDRRPLGDSDNQGYSQDEARTRSIPRRPP